MRTVATEALVRIERDVVACRVDKGHPFNPDRALAESLGGKRSGGAIMTRLDRLKALTRPRVGRTNPDGAARKALWHTPMDRQGAQAPPQALFRGRAFRRDAPDYLSSPGSMCTTSWGHFIALQLNGERTQYSHPATDWQNACRE